ncbi:hypothetical protein DFH09DRAFT_1285884 [Mycena vulgaris]|nr:hypothetical protein DFH09DRAFT_1285884 [Mycena vulgaris]
MAASVTSKSLAPLLQSNEAPLPTQAALVQDILRTEEVTLSALGAEISALQFKLRILQKKHDNLTSEMNQLTRILSPIRRLPLEIIGEIFLYFSPSSHVDWQNTRKRHRVILPWELGQICRLWRTVALSLGQLWSVLDISFGRRTPSKCWAPRLVEDNEEEGLMLPRLIEPVNHDYEPEYGYGHWPYLRFNEFEEGLEIEARLDFIAGCLQRSGNRPLSICLCPTDFAVFALLDRLLKHSARWGEIVLIDPSLLLLDRISHFEGNFQQLQKIVFVRSFEHNFRYQCVPNLTDLSLVDVTLPPGCSSHIPWSQLTRYREINCWWDESEPTDRLASYRQLENLIILRLDVLHQWLLPETMVSGVSLSFPKLRVASFRFHCITNIDVLQSFDMPVLEVVSVDGFGTSLSISGPLPCLKILRARIPLRECEDAAEHILEMCPALTELALDGPDLISNHLISRLTSNSDEPPICPKLQTIRFSNRAFLHNECKWTTFLEMLRARFKPTMETISPLRAFEFYVGRHADETVVTSLKLLRRRTQWDIKVGDECKWPEWDNLHLLTT